MSMVKICGLSRECDIDYVNSSKPDYIGFVFSNSKRRVTPKQAEKLKLKLSSGIKAVGVFVNEPLELIADLCRQNIIDVVQLHGDEDNDYISKVKSITGKSVIKAVRVQSTQQILQAEALNCDCLLLDTYKKSTYGGVGESFNWQLIPTALKKPFFLAGGLNTENVETAIKTVRPYCVDVSSGVETDGFKDEKKIRNIIEKVRRTH